MIIDTSKPREKWFEKPPIGEKMSRRTLRLSEGTNDKEVVESMMNLGKDETLIIPYSYRILPERIRGKYKDIEDPNAKKFKKYGKLVFLNVPASRENAMSMHLNPHELMAAKFNKVQLGDRCRGYGWRGISRITQLRLVPLIAAIDGYAIYLFFGEVGREVYKTKGIPREEITYRDYGAYAFVTLPSRSMREGKTQYVRLDMLRTNPDSIYADWTEIAAESSSKDKLFREISHKYVSPEIVFTGHVIAAYRKAQKERSTYGDPDPFAIFSEEGIRYDDNLMNNVVVEHRKDSRIVRANPNEAEREILLWKLLGYKNMRAAGEEGTRAYESLFRRNYDGVENYMVKIL